jgi:hypothetical protein
MMMLFLVLRLSPCLHGTLSSQESNMIFVVMAVPYDRKLNVRYRERKRVEDAPKEGL